MFERIPWDRLATESRHILMQANTNATARIFTKNGHKVKSNQVRQEAFICSYGQREISLGFKIQDFNIRIAFVLFIFCKKSKRYVLIPNLYHLNLQKRI